jgi:CRP-like cAMP-binding protein
VREAARIVEGRILAAVPPARPATVLRSHDMMLNEQDLERVLVLKRIPLFRHLPLDTLLAVSRSVESQQYLPGDVIVQGGERLEHCHILEAGAVSIERGGSIEPLPAPACFNELVLVGEAAPGGRIVAVEACRILRLHAVVLQDLSRDYPEILLEICRDLARRLRAVERPDLRGGPVPPLGAFSS